MTVQIAHACVNHSPAGVASRRISLRQYQNRSLARSGWATKTRQRVTFLLT